MKSVGYDQDAYEIIDNIGKQSNDISIGVDKRNGQIGAGDQGMMFGYACAETKECLPKAMVILQKFAKAYDKLRKEVDELLPDGKAQITGLYDEDFRLEKIIDFTISYQNAEVNRVYTDFLVENVAREICDKYNIEVESFLINPTGKFLIGGFDADAGLTGRKIVVDSYQSFANVGGGCMNGKDPSKVDFSGAHKARQLAKRLLKEHNLKWCEVQLSYAIGISEPLAIYINSDKGNIEPKKSMYKECTPSRIIKDLGLLDVDYEKLAQFGHFTD